MFERIPTTVRAGVTILLLGVGTNVFIFEETSPSYWSYDDSNRFSSIGIILVIAGISLLIRSVFAALAAKRNRMKVSFTSLGPAKGELHLDVKAHPIDKPIQRKISQLVFTPIVLMALVMMIIGVGSFIAIYRWLNSRTFIPIYRSFTLTQGRVRTGPFEINLNNYYVIKLQGYEISYPTCTYTDYANGINAKVTLYSNGKVAHTWEVNNAYSELAGFEAKKGTTYDLDITILSDSACFDTGHPALAIYTKSSTYTDVTSPCLVISTLMAIAGLGLIILGIAETTGENHIHILQLTDAATFGQYVPYAQSLPLREQFIGFPAFSMVGIIVLFTGWAALAVMETPPTPKGIHISLLKPGKNPIWPDEWTEPIILRVVDVGAGKDPELEINSKRFNWNEMNEELKKEIGRRKPGATIYIKADPDLPWADIAYALDFARGFHVKVVLLTSP